jgi:A/G-specific adenine glycosylase
VVPYWERWLRELPDIQSLARAGREKVLKLWEGLGYYARARRLQEAAQLIVSRHGGAFPRPFEEVLGLPGIGRYTAGAICSIAFNQAVPVLDGNVVRVLARFLGLRQNPREKQASTMLWATAEDLVKAACEWQQREQSSRALRPPRVNEAPTPTFRDPRVLGYCSALNQSLMELGAIICTPARPVCRACPLRRSCVARREGLQELLPVTDSRACATSRTMVVLVLEHSRRYLVRQRSEHGVNAHLWEFPAFEAGPGEVEGVLRRARRRYHAKPKSVRLLGTIQHSITRYRFTIHIYRAEAGRVSLSQGDRGKWLTPQEVEALPFTAAHRRIWREFIQPDWATLIGARPPQAG